SPRPPPQCWRDGCHSKSYQILEASGVRWQHHGTVCRLLSSVKDEHSRVEVSSNSCWAGHGIRITVCATPHSFCTLTPVSVPRSFGQGGADVGRPGIDLLHRGDEVGVDRVDDTPLV